MYMTALVLYIDVERCIGLNVYAPENVVIKHDFRFDGVTPIVNSF